MTPKPETPRSIAEGATPPYVEGHAWRAYLAGMRADRRRTEECSGCGSTAMLEEIQAAGGVSCCPERKMVPREATLLARISHLESALGKIADESVFNQPRYAEDSDADYFLRCFKAVKESCRRALSQASEETGG